MIDAAAQKTGLVINYQRLVDVAVFIFVACGAIAIIEPSPYDFASLVAMPLWFLGGFSINRSFLVFAFLIIAYTMMGFLALIPYWDSADSSLYQYQSAYLVLTGLFYALFMGNETNRRVNLCLNAYIAGALIASIAGILGYSGIPGFGEGVFLHAGRASGTFKDPNVLGSFLVLPIVTLAHRLIVGPTRSVILTGAMLLVVFLGMFLSFSRGSYGATVVAFVLMLASVFVASTDRKMKRRIAMAALGAVAMIGVVIAVVLSVPETREFFSQRTAATQDYDEGSTGRFGNQLRSIPMLLDRFMGFGPLRFRLIFDLEPHNSYVGAFANNGWIGGLLFFLLIGVTAFIGLRLMFTLSPAQRQAQAVVPAAIGLFLQGFQIDVDHWRFVFFMLGAVWGLEAQRQRWIYRGREPLTPPSRPAAPASSR
ncbi:O-antigen ligase family protein [Methylocystis sp. JR02]|uniref:O-antigen ligase family protein n=1 Tax=Methylocystis sp. JR02 TaxID=3046284 RepID=UPI0024B9E37A|nr:O-antigen ligase family protein [Methylocystis sp. JR02]MDJ0447284.1 O-antigen ligase family protein [Methylocystis sp. JR02]